MLRSTLAVAALLVSLVPTVAATAAAPPTGEPTGSVGPGSSADADTKRDERRPSVTRTGTVQRLAVDRRRGPARIEWYLDGDDGRQRLVAPGPELVAGAVATVTGSATRRGITVDEVTTRRPAPEPARSTGRRDVVVLKAVRAPSQTTGSPWFIDKTRALVDDLSEGRARLRIRELPWTKIRGFDPCSTRRWASIGRTMREAARRQGHRIGRPDHLVYYAPCFRRDGISGVGELPGDESWIFLGTDQVAAHELGHNYGLHHAGLRRCRAEQFNVPDSDRCFHERYDDTYDLMGKGRSMSAVHQARLGWLGSTVVTVRESATRTLVPVESSGDGTRGLRVIGPEHTWWLDVDRVRDDEPAKYPGRVALHVRRQLPDGSLELWHLVPQLNPYNVGWVPSDVGLPLTSTWTTPDGVRLDVLASSRRGVRVEVDLDAPAPEPPAPPSDIRVERLKDETVVTFRQSTEDNGAPIWGYDVTSTRGGVPPCEDSECNIETPYAEHSPGQRDSVMHLLDLPARSTRIEIRAISAAGRSEPAYSEEFVPRTSGPTVELHGAVGGPVVSGRTELSVTARPNEVSGAALSPYVTLYVNGERTRINAFLDEEGRGVDVPLGSLPNGPATLMVEVGDERARSARSEPVDVVVDNPVLRITSPGPGDPVSHLTTVTYEIENRQGWTFERVSGEPAPYVGVGAGPRGDDGEVEIEAAWKTGPFEIEVVAHDPYNGDLTATVPVVADNPVPTITIPDVDGRTFTSGRLERTPVLWPETWPWDSLDWQLLVDGRPGGHFHQDRLSVLLMALSEGEHTLELRGRDVAGRNGTSGVARFTVDHPELSARLGETPAEDAVVNWSTRVDYEALPADWGWYEARLEVEGHGIVDYADYGEELRWWSKDMPNGTYRLRAVLVDLLGEEVPTPWRTVHALNVD